MRERLILPGKMAPVNAWDRCDRCDHEARAHVAVWGQDDAGPWTCRKRVGTDRVKEFDREREVALFCPCDAFIPSRSVKEAQR